MSAEKKSPPPASDHQNVAEKHFPMTLPFADDRKQIATGELQSGLLLWSSSWASCGFESKAHSTASCSVVITRRQAAYGTVAK
ncbi:MAG: hypothetical protein R3C59_18920 [Planctomycetaceae bacterium]